jgi:hypothetical protein
LRTRTRKVVALYILKNRAIIFGAGFVHLVQTSQYFGGTLMVRLILRCPPSCSVPERTISGRNPIHAPAVPLDRLTLRSRASEERAIRCAHNLWMHAPALRSSPWTFKGDAQPFDNAGTCKRILDQVQAFWTSLADGKSALGSELRRVVRRRALPSAPARQLALDPLSCSANLIGRRTDRSPPDVTRSTRECPGRC